MESIRKPIEAIQARYRSTAPEVLGPWNQVLATMLSHKSVRTFLPNPVSDEILRTIVAAAQSAPTSSNMQCWSVVAVRNEASKKALAKIAGGQKHIEQCPLFLVWIADLSRLRGLHLAAGTSGTGLDFFESFLVAALDAALAAQNAAVALESLGLAGVYIGALRNDPEAVASLLDLPREAFPVFGFCVGYPNVEAGAAVKPRLPQNVVLHSERYRDKLMPQTIVCYDADMKAFQAEQDMPPTGWALAMLKRTRDAKSLKGRDKLVDALQKRGFGLL